MTTSDTDGPGDWDAALPTFAILARFVQVANSAEAAVGAVTKQLVDAGKSFDQVALERQDEASTWLVVARIVTVSLDAHTAVAGVLDDLVEAGLAPDEVWAERQVA
jgi:hypothetical protein